MAYWGLVKDIVASILVMQIKTCEQDSKSSFIFHKGGWL